MSPSERATLPRPRTAARKASGVVFPVVPQRTTFVRRVALIVLVTTALGAGAQRYLSTAPAALDLVATLAPTVVAPPVPTPTAAPPTPTPTPTPVKTSSPPRDSAVVPRAPAPVERKAPPAKATRPQVQPQPQRRAVTAPASLPVLPPPVTFQETPVNTAPGSLVVSATPWGAVSVDGNAVGNSPVMGISLAGGQHRVRIVRDGFEPYDRIVTVVAGETLRLTGIVLSPRRNP